MNALGWWSLTIAVASFGLLGFLMWRHWARAQAVEDAAPSDGDMESGDVVLDMKEITVELDGDDASPLVVMYQSPITAEELQAVFVVLVRQMGPVLATCALQDVIVQAAALEADDLVAEATDVLLGGAA